MNRLTEKNIIIYLKDEYSCSESIFAEGKDFNIFKFTFQAQKKTILSRKWRGLKYI